MAKSKGAREQSFPIDIFLKLSKDYSLKDQMNKASGSVMDNIGEGFGRGSKNEFIQFLTIARGSLAEVQLQLYRALDRKYFSQQEFEVHYCLSEEVAKMLTTFVHYLNKSNIAGDKFKNRVANNSKPQTPN